MLILWKSLVSFLAVNILCETGKSYAISQTKDFLATNNSLILFVTRLVNAHFSNCSVMMLHNKLNSYSAQLVNPVLQSIPIGKYVLTFPNSSDTASLPVNYPKHLFNIAQRRDSCMVTLIFVSAVATTFMNQIKKTIAPTFLPITRKDVDHFIFVSEASVHENILLEEVLASKIKFKIAVGLNTNNQVQVATIDFFGGPNGSPKVEPLPTESYEHIKDAIFPDFIWNLRGRTLQISITFGRSIVEATPSWTKINNAKRGCWKYLLEEYFMVKFNFTYRMFPSTGKDGNIGGGGSGLQLPNGTWIGVTGDLYYGRADLGIPIANTDKRIQYIGFTDSIFDTGFLTFVTSPASKLYSTQAVFWPFTATLWIVILSSIFGAFCYFYIMSNFLRRIHLESSSSKVGTQIMLILAPFVEQDAHFIPFSAALRCFCVFWSFFAIIITTLYRSKLVTLLAFPVLGELPKTFDDLAFSGFQVGFMKNGDSAYSTFSRSKDPVYVALIKRMKVIKGVNIECLDKVINQTNYACIAYDFDVKYLKEKNFSDMNARKLTYSNARTYNVWLGIATEAHSIYRVNFGKVLSQIQAFHLAEVWDKMDKYDNVRKPKLKWWEEVNLTRTMLRKYDEDSARELTFSNIKGVFYIFIYCTVFSFIAFWNEMVSCKSLCARL